MRYLFSAFYRPNSGLATKIFQTDFPLSGPFVPFVVFRRRETWLNVVDRTAPIWKIRKRRYLPINARIRGSNQECQAPSRQ